MNLDEHLRNKFAEYEAKLRVVPADLTNYTKIIVTHPYHGQDAFYLSCEEFQERVVGVIATYWANGYTILMVPC